MVGLNSKMAYKQTLIYCQNDFSNTKHFQFDHKLTPLEKPEMAGSAISKCPYTAKSIFVLLKNIIKHHS